MSLQKVVRLGGTLAVAGAMAVAGLGVTGLGTAHAHTPNCEKITPEGVARCDHAAYMKFKLKNGQELTLCITPEGRRLGFRQDSIADIAYQNDANPADRDCQVR